MRRKLSAVLLSLALILSLTAAPAAALEKEDAIKLLRDNYVDKIPESILELDSLEDILEALGDPYTSYMSAEDYQSFLSIVNGDSVVGIGVSLQTTFQDGYTIMSILPDSPALDSGLEAGDRIVAVDGTALTADMDIVGMITGEAGTAVTVTVVRQSDGQSRDYTLTRRLVVIPIVTYEMQGDAGWISCTSFGASTAPTIQEALETLDGDVSIWIMDLRSNPGGTDEASSLAASLFSGNSVIAYFRDANGNYWYRPVFCNDLTDKPLIILTSSYSASGSELFSAAARDYGFAIAVGQRTFGKGIAQNILDARSDPDLFGEDALKVTAFRFYSPSGTTNHIVGVLPTLLVSPENTVAVSLLLSTPEPSRAGGYLKLELAGQTFYIDPNGEIAGSYPEAFCELLEALPPAAVLYQGAGVSTWKEVSPRQIASEHGFTLGGQYNPRTFSDIDGSPFQREIETLAAYQLLSGDNGAFYPERTITRAEFCAMVSTALNLPASEAALAPFSDVSADAWYSGAVSAMVARGFLSGYGDGTLRPGSTITYEEMVTILASVAAWSSMDGYELSQEEIPIGKWLNYYEFSPWARNSAYMLDELGTQTDGLSPSEPCTRETAAGLLCSLMESLHMIWN